MLSKKRACIKALAASRAIIAHSSNGIMKRYKTSKSSVTKSKSLIIKAALSESMYKEL